MSGLPSWYLAVLGLFFGSAIASFLGVVAERVPQGLGIGGRSHCVCGRQLRAVENVPILGWIRSRGVAGCCGSRIPVRYVVTELLLGALCALAAVLWGVAGIAATLTAATVAVTATALRRRSLSQGG